MAKQDGWKTLKAQPEPLLLVPLGLGAQGYLLETNMFCFLHLEIDVFYFS